jgi:hypothetical protein
MKNNFAKFLFLSTILTASVSYGSEQQDDLSESLYYGNKSLIQVVDPSISRPKQAFHKGNETFVHEISSKAKRLISLGKQIKNGDFSEVSAELIEIVLAKLTGESQHNFLKSQDKEFDQKVIAKAARGFEAKLAGFLDGIVNSTNLRGYVKKTGEDVVILQNRTVFRAIAEISGLTKLPLGGLFVSAVDNGIIKNYLDKKLHNLIIAEAFSFFQAKNGMTLKESIGQFIGGLLQKKSSNSEVNVEKESSQNLIKLNEIIDNSVNLQDEETALSPLWEYFEPRLKHYVRSVLLGILGEAKKEFMDSFSQQAKSISSVLGGMGGAGLTSLITGGNIVPLLVGGVSGVYTYYQVDAQVKMIDERLSVLIETLGYKLIDYTKREHALYGLNESPSELEKNLFYHDYLLQEKLMNQSFFGQALRQITYQLGVEESVWSILGYAKNGYNAVDENVRKLVSYLIVNKQISIEEALEDNKLTQKVSLTPTETMEKAYMTFVRLKSRGYKINSEQKKILENIEAFPSYEVKKRHITNLLDSQILSFSHDEEKIKSFQEKIKKSNEKFSNTKKFLENIDQVTEDLGFLLLDRTRQKTKKVLTFFDLHLWTIAQKDLSPSSLEVLVDAVKDKGFLLNYLDNPYYFSESPIHTLIDNLTTKVSEEKGITQRMVIRAFVNDLLEAYAKHKHETFLQENEKVINNLKTHTLVEGLSTAEIVDLLKNHRDTLEKEGYLLPVQEKVEKTYNEVVEHEKTLLKKKYKELMVRQVAETHFALVKQEFESTIDGFILKALKSNEILDAKKIRKDVNSKLVEDNAFASLRKKFKEKYGDSTQEVSALFYNYVSGFILDKAQKALDKKGSLEDDFEVVVNEDSKSGVKETPKIIVKNENSGFFGRFFGNNQQIEIVEEVKSDWNLKKEIEQKELPLIPVTKLEVYEKTDIMGMNLAEVVNSALTKKVNNFDEEMSEIVNPLFEQPLRLELSDDDVELIYRSIQENKKKKVLVGDDVDLIEHHLQELIAFKGTVKRLENKVFYGYQEILEDLRQANKQKLQEILSKK